MPPEAGFFLHRSNRTERLLGALAQVVAEPASADPLAAETIVVQGQGMGRWLSMALSRRLGVWARPDFRLMRELLDGCARSAEARESAADLFEPDTLGFAIAHALLELEAEPGFEVVRGYLGDDDDRRRLLQLAGRLATIFDGYTTARPDWLATWAAGRSVPGLSSAADTEVWQARLWRRLQERAEGPSHDRRMAALRSRLDAAAIPPEGLPPRVSVFGLSTLPPLHVDVLRSLARHVPVHLFVLAPTDAWWADLRSQREQWRAAGRTGESVAGTREERAAIEGHALLAAFGRLGRDFQQTLESQVDYLEPEPADEPHGFVDPLETSESPTLLQRLQSSMLRLDADAGDAAKRSAPLTADRDHSVRVHVCHSPLREVEVLHDQLLDLFERDPTLEPKDVVVMSPDIERHAPLVEAVFGSRGAGGGRPAIAHRIADRSIVVTREGVAAFLQLLDTLSGRFAAGAVLDLLRAESVAESYGLGADALERLDEWTRRAGIRWGLDAAHRASEGLPEDDLHTWRYGLDRLLLGVAMDPGDAPPWQGRLAVADVEGDDARAVGALAAFLADLGDAREQVRQPLAPADWKRVLAELAARFIVARDDNTHHHQALRDAFDALARHAAAAGFEHPIGLAAVRGLLLRSLRASTPSHGFLSGGVTFCEMVPMRSIPFRVVCMLGLDDGAFPRISRAPGFDLMARHPRVGDRTTRDDDRSLFLEAILSARDHLVVTHVGRDIRDGEARPPSVVVTELLDALRDELGVSDGADEADGDDDGDDLPGFWQRHPLKPFDPRYFGGERARGARAAAPLLASYDAAALRGAQALLAPRRDASPFVADDDRSFEAVEGDAGERADSGEGAAAGARTLELAELRGFLRHASRDFLRQTLGVRVDSPEAPERDREPAGLAGLEGWAVGEAVLQGVLAGDDEARIEARLRAQGALPPGELGTRSFAEVAREARRLARRRFELAGADGGEAVDVDLAFDGVRLVGRIDGVSELGRVRCSYSKLGGPPELDAWVEHLALCAQRGEGAACSTTLIGRIDGDTAWVRFGPVEGAMEKLADLVAVWQAGRHVPVPFFPRSARAYWEKWDGVAADDPRAEHTESQAIQNAYNAYRGGDAGWGSDRSEREREADIRFLWRGRSPLDETAEGDADSASASAALGFRALSRRVYAAMLEARETGA